MRFARIVTHLFADGGRIIKTTKTDYSEQVEQSDVSRVVRSMMKEQHRAMFASLRAGELDTLLERAIGPLSDTPPAARAAARRAESVRPPRVAPSERPRRNRSLSNPALHGVAKSVVPPSADAFDFDVASLDKLPLASRPAPSTRPPRKSNPPRRSRPPRGPANLPQRPAAQFASAPEATARSIFGDEAISEQTLDEVILSYLAEDLDGSKE